MMKTTKMLGLAAGICAIVTASIASIAQKPGVAVVPPTVPKPPVVVVDTIKVSKHFYVASNGTVLVSAVSSDGKAHLLLKRSSGVLIGEVQNGNGGKYGGTVFFAGKDPVTLTVVSSSGGTSTFKTAPFQP